MHSIRSHHSAGARTVACPDQSLPSTQAPIVRVALIPSQGNLDVLDYFVPELLVSAVTLGSRVVVPLGHRFAFGIVVSTTEYSAAPQLRPVAACLDPSGPLFDSSWIELARWMAEYYLSSVSDALTTMIPSTVKVRVERLLQADPEALDRVADARDRKAVEYLIEHPLVPFVALQRRLKIPKSRLERLCREGLLKVTYRARASAPSLLTGPLLVRVANPLPEFEADIWAKKRPALYSLYEYVRHHPSGFASLEELKANFPSATAKIRILEQVGILERVRLPAEPPPPSPDPKADPEVRLTGHQDDAVRQLIAGLSAGFQPFLLYGVTGSGKTEVYLRAAKACVDAGRSVLVLVPEISLTHQLVSSLKARFGEAIAVLHSGLSARERWQCWERLASGTLRVAAGARSAVFAPVPNLGLIIVDEEHDSAYKQEEGLRYNARDVAVVRARLANCPIVLGSATPSLESYHNALQGRYRLLRLPERVDTRPLPVVEVVDLRGTNAQGRALPLSHTLYHALQANLANKQQSLLFLNRRGYARFLQCLQCGAVFSCPNCSVSLTYHQRNAALQCHHCGRTTPAPRYCPACEGTAVAAWSAGTEQVELTLRRLFPHARIARLDRDVARQPAALAEVLEQWSAGRYDFLVGTQMVTKGHHVPNVTLVGVILADLSRNFPDFRSGERTFQLLTQVAGRAGRGEKPGRVIVQTYRPDDPILQWAARHDYEGFAQYELAHRGELSYPPFSRLVLARIEAPQEQEAERIAAHFAQAARTLAGQGLDVLGPAPAPLLRLRGWYRWQVLLRSKHSALARKSAAGARTIVREGLPRNTRVRIILDVDPQSLL
ncbi:Primosomal protein N' [bacterium HR30]|nr:Primosomal protein N' [bacterium HR30]